VEFFIRQKLPTKILGVLNKCCLYLQVITLSDIVSAPGNYILPEVKIGQRTPDRISTLSWPVQGLSSRQDWRHWQQELSPLEHWGKLITTLGKWIRPPTEAA
jgi:hypothetical protein